jgi:Predicted aspartyl protease
MASPFGNRRTIGQACAAAALAASLCTGCATNRINSRRAAQADFWSALSELRPDAAAKYSRTFSQKLFATSLRYMMDGNMESAEAGFASLQAMADDSLLRAGARVAYSAVLQYEEKWNTLSRVAPYVAPNRDADRAGVERWAAAFANVSPKVIEFPARTVILPLSLSVAATPVIPVRIHGKDYHFWLDTGSSLTIVSSAVAAALGLAPISADTLEMVTNTGRVRAQPATVDRIELGRIAVKNAVAMIVDESSMEMREMKRAESAPRATPVKIDGIIGFDIIHQIDVEIDYGAGEVRLRNPALRRNNDPASRNLFWLGIPVVRLRASDGTWLHFGLDTGAEATSGTETLLDKLDISERVRENRNVGGLAGVASLQAPIVHQLNVTVRDHPLFLREMLIYAPVYRTLVSLDGVLGADASRAGVVRLDATNGIFSVDEGIRKPATLN